MLRPNPGTPRYALGSVIAAGSVVGMLKEAAKSSHELPVETVPPILPLSEPYVTTGGQQIPLPQQKPVPDIIKLPEETLPVIPESLDNPDLILPEETDYDIEVPMEKVTTPCKIVIRKLDVKDIDLWKPKPKRQTHEQDDDDPVPKTAGHQPQLPKTPNRPKPAAAGSSTSVGTPKQNTPGGFRLVSGYGLRNRPKPTL